MNEINLVSGKNLSLEKQLKLLKILKISAVLSLIIVVSISIFFFVGTLLLPISSVKTSQSQTLQNISQMHKTLATFVLTKDRIKTVQKIIATRKDYPQISSSILDILPSDMVVEAISFDENNLTVTATGPSLLSINQFIDDFIKLSNNNNHINNLNVQDLQYISNLSIYSLTFQASVL